MSQVYGMNGPMFQTFTLIYLSEDIWHKATQKDDVIRQQGWCILTLDSNNHYLYERMKANNHMPHF